ncbi:ATP-dependent DNA ligase [Streptomyces sp. NPDC057638]|uniref:ATP-dependent DNA ligase n=1 Tax=Streptomyces sp. NPDC057638 TaxID=3346190 RepID=UPI0036A08654
MLRPPVRVAGALSVGTLPTGDGLAYEPKFDGHRVVVFRLDQEVVLQARSGRIITAAFPDLAAAAGVLPVGTVLDGEVVVWSEGRTDFAAVQRRAAATPGRAPALARRLPASYAAFDLLADRGEDIRGWSYARRRRALVALLAPLGPPIQAVPMTQDPREATEWYTTLPAIGVEGLVVKRLDQGYRVRGRAWSKLRHTAVRDAPVLGFTGTARRPEALVVAVPDDDTPQVSAPLSAPLRAEAADALVREVPEGTAVSGRPEKRESPGLPLGVAMAAGRGEVTYQPVRAGVIAEVASPTTRHPSVSITVLRLRLPQDLPEGTREEP